MPRTTVAHPDGGPGEGAGDRAGAPSMVEVDMGDDDVSECIRLDPQRLQATLDGRGRSLRAGLDECGLLSVNEIGRSHEVPADHLRVDAGDAISDSKSLVHGFRSLGVSGARA